MTIASLGTVGGILMLLIVTHFIIDWIPQSHDEAMAKSTNSRVRARHCATYAAGFVPLFLIAGVTAPMYLLYIAILFVSHYYEDTYIPVMLWMKHVRKVPTYGDTLLLVDVPMAGLPVGSTMARPSNDKERFIRYITDNDTKTLGVILMIAVDQIIHIAFLVPIAFLMVLN